MAVLLVVGALLPVSCARWQPTVLERESLFSLEIGRLEDQIDLFERDGVAPRLKNRVIMRDGLVFLANGAANKVMQFTSYGDLVALLYAAGENPPPITLQRTTTRDAISTRVANEYPFYQLGDIAVDSAMRIMVEDQLPLSRSVFDTALRVQLNRVILRFSAQGRLIDYLGQEGVGGTPFPYIESMRVNSRDQLVVICSTVDGKLVYVFAPNGDLVYTTQIDLRRLPVPDTEHEYITVLDSVSAGVDADRVYIKVSYFLPAVDEETDKQYGIAFDHTRIYWIDLNSGRYESFVELPRTAPGLQATSLQFEFLGAARGEHFFLISRLERGDTLLLIMNDSGRVIRRRTLYLEESKLEFRQFDLTHSGILTALLAYRDHAEVVWWRTDRLLPAGR